MPEQQHGLPRELGDVGRPAAGQSVLPGHHERHVHRVEQWSFERIRPDGKDADLHVTRVDVPAQPLGGRFDELHLHPRMPAAEDRCERREHGLDDLRRCADADRTGTPALEHASSLRERLHIVEQTTRSLQQVSAVRRQLHTATHAVE